MTTTEHPVLAALKTIAAKNSDAPGVRTRESIRRCARDAIPALEALLAEHKAMREALEKAAETLESIAVSDQVPGHCEYASKGQLCAYADRGAHYARNALAKARGES